MVGLVLVLTTAVLRGIEVGLSLVVFESIPEATRRLGDGSPISPWPGWELLLDAIGSGAGVLEDSLARSGARSRGPFEIAGGAEKCMT